MFHHQFIPALQAHGVKTRMHQIEGAGHLLAAMNPEALDQAYSFLQQELQGKAQAPVESTSPAGTEIE